MSAKPHMSGPSKRFILPYEPEYTGHRSDSRTHRAAQLHRSARRRGAAPALASRDSDNGNARDATPRK